MKRYAIISDCKKYRYLLNRCWDPSLPNVLWIMLNPSTADSTEDDHTIRRCINFSKDLGFGSLYVVNLFAYRSTDPRELKKVDDPIGPNNDYYIGKYGTKFRIIAAWGAQSSYRLQMHHIGGLINKDELYCLDLSLGGYPKHPLYLSKNCKLKKYDLHKALLGMVI